MTMEKELFCKQCYRKDEHAQLRCSISLKAVLIIITFGLAWVFWPKRCLCCGKIRLPF